VLRHLPHGRAHRLLDALPRTAAQSVEPGRPGGRSHVLGDEIEALDGKIEAAALRILEKEEIALAAIDLHGLEPVVAADPVSLVDHEVIGLQVGEGGDGLTALEDGAAEAAAACPEDVLLGEDDQTEGGQLESRRAVARDDAEPSPLHREAPGHGSRSCSLRMPWSLAPAGRHPRRGAPRSPRPATRGWWPPAP
jgi:hypothetical protein